VMASTEVRFGERSPLGTMGSASGVATDGLRPWRPSSPAHRPPGSSGSTHSGHAAGTRLMPRGKETRTQTTAVWRQEGQPGPEHSKQTSPAGIDRQRTSAITF
jgi:hypothetical protein